MNRRWYDHPRSHVTWTSSHQEDEEEGPFTFNPIVSAEVMLTCVQNECFFPLQRNVKPTVFQSRCDMMWASFFWLAKKSGKIFQLEVRSLQASLGVTSATHGSALSSNRYGGCIRVAFVQAFGERCMMCMCTKLMVIKHRWSCSIVTKAKFSMINSMLETQLWSLQKYLNRSQIMHFSTCKRRSGNMMYDTVWLGTHSIAFTNHLLSATQHISKMNLCVWDHTEWREHHTSRGLPCWYLLSSKWCLDMLGLFSTTKHQTLFSEHLFWPTFNLTSWFWFLDRSASFRIFDGTSSLQPQLEKLGTKLKSCCRTSRVSAVISVEKAFNFCRSWIYTSLDWSSWWPFFMVFSGVCIDGWVVSPLRWLDRHLTLVRHSQIGLCFPEPWADVRICLTCELAIQLRISWIEFELIRCRNRYEMNQIQII